MITKKIAGMLMVFLYLYISTSAQIINQPDIEYACKVKAVSNSYFLCLNQNQLIQKVTGSKAIPLKQEGYGDLKFIKVVVWERKSLEWALFLQTQSDSAQLEISATPNRGVFNNEVRKIILDSFNVTESTPNYVIRGLIRNDNFTPIDEEVFYFVYLPTDNVYFLGKNLAPRMPDKIIDYIYALYKRLNPLMLKAKDGGKHIKFQLKTKPKLYVDDIIPTL